MLHLKPPTALLWNPQLPSIFLAGSIEMGKAEDWQSQVAAALSDLDVVILNPRREAWDSSWEQSIDNPVFREQVEWELQALESATYRIFHFEPGTMSPITLMELGLFAEKGNNIVHCPQGFWRKGNVDIVCERYGLAQSESIASAIDWLRKKILATPQI